MTNDQSDTTIQSIDKSYENRLTLVTMGDPASIGLYLSLLAWIKYNKTKNRFCLLANDRYLSQLNNYYQLSVPIQAVTNLQAAKDCWHHALPVMNICNQVYGQPGQPNKGDMSNILKSLELGVDYCLNNNYDNDKLSLLTNPVCKHRLYDAGFNYGGQTEYIAHLCNLSHKKVAMLFLSRKMITMPLTYHVPVSLVSHHLKKHLIKNRIKLLQQYLQQRGIINPSLALISLNPHGGENSYCGIEESQIINPVAIILRKQGISITNAQPLETLCRYKNYDAFICAYHDQALLPIKMLNYLNRTGVVNFTAGLPFIRTSPAHGTAFELAKRDRCKNIYSYSFDLALEYSFLENNCDYS